MKQSYMYPHGIKTIIFLPKLSKNEDSEHVLSDVIYLML